jgi:hypothetical protein
MSARGDRSGFLKWYPEEWRDRYGDELMVLLDDHFGTGRVPLAARASMMRAGSTERLRCAGIIGRSVNPERRVRGASLVVLCGWALFVIAGSGFAKYAEHWDLVTPRHDRPIPSAAFLTVQAAAAVGVVIFSVAVLVALPALVHRIRERGWGAVRTPLRVTIVTSGIALVATVSIIMWSHHSASPPLNHGLWPDKIAGVAWVIVVVAAIACGTAAIVAVVTQLDPSRGAARALGVLAVAMAAVLLVIFLGMVTWWISTAINAPWFFGSGARGSTGDVAPPAMIGTGVLMVAGLVLGMYGAVSVMRNLRRVSRL